MSHEYNYWLILQKIELTNEWRHKWKQHFDGDLHLDDGKVHEHWRPQNSHSGVRGH